MRIVCLVDNSPSPSGSLKGEYGLSFYLPEKKILFDVGSSGLFLANAKKLGLDVSLVEDIVISHGHWDHGDGLVALEGRLKKTPRLWLGPDFFGKKYSLDAQGPRYNGTSWQRDWAEKNFVLGNYSPSRPLKEGRPWRQELGPGLWLIGGFERNYTQERIAERLCLKMGEAFVQDGFNDEQALVIEGKKGLSLVVGCAHPGIMNMADTAKALFKQPLLAIYGGIHLYEADEARLQACIDYFSRHEQLDSLALGHCTGELAIKQIAENFKIYRPLHSGASFTLESP